MIAISRRACARVSGSILALAALVAQAEAPAAPLSLPEAERLALAHQPLLDAQRATVAAARERAVAMRQLPDPMLVTGIQNLPVNGADRYSTSMDPMTMETVGLMQEFPLPAKRRLRGEAEGLMATAGEARLAVLQRTVRRDTAMAWIDLWFAERAAELTAAMASQSDGERAAADIAYRAGRVPQADLLAADVEVELLRDRVRKLEQDAAEAREKLARWIGQPVTDKLPADVPALREPPSLEALLAGLDRHPEIAQAGAEVAAAENSVALAKEMYWPDWKVEAMYGRRPEFDEMVSLQFSVELPVFRGDRQDREAGAARAQLASSQATREDMKRQLRALAAQNYRGWKEATARLARYDEAIVPRSAARSEAALAAYRVGKVELMAVIAARRSALEAALMRLDLQMEVLKRASELRYVNVEGE